MVRETRLARGHVGRTQERSDAVPATEPPPENVPELRSAWSGLLDSCEFSAGDQIANGQVSKALAASLDIASKDS